MLQAFRMALDLGLRNCDHWDISAEEKERRKRVFWCCFIADRIISAVYGRTATFEESDCDVPFPSVDHLESTIDSVTQQLACSFTIQDTKHANQ